MKLTFVDNTYIPLLVAKVDQQADAARAKVVGDPVRVKEYEIAQSQAEVFKGSGYTMDPVPQYIKSWAEAKEWTAQQACDDILAAAALWMGALGAIRDLRLKAKESIRGAASSSAAQATFDTFSSTLTTMMQGVQ